MAMLTLLMELASPIRLYRLDNGIIGFTMRYPILWRDILQKVPENRTGRRPGSVPAKSALSLLLLD